MMRRIRGWRLFRRRERGQALIEFAFAALAFFTLVLGSIDVGRAVWHYNTLSGATREGARYAIVHGAMSSDPSGPGSAYFTSPDSDTKVTERVLDFTSGLDSSQITVKAEWLDGTNDVGNRVQVTTEYQYDPIFDFFGIVSFDMSSSSIMKITY